MLHGPGDEGGDASVMMDVLLVRRILCTFYYSTEVRKIRHTLSKILEDCRNSLFGQGVLGAELGSGAGDVVTTAFASGPAEAVTASQTLCELGCYQPLWQSPCSW
jgi:hypothetical protein